MKTKTVNITRRDIKLGVRPKSEDCVVESYDCPVARAASRVFRVRCAASRDCIVLPDDEIDLPDEAKEFIERFDCGQMVHPLKFTVEVE